MHYRRRREGEHQLYGSIQRVDMHTPKSHLADLLVRGAKHVGMYELNIRRMPPDMPNLDNAAFCLFTDVDGNPIRLYIAGRRVGSPRKGVPAQIGSIIKIHKIFVEYTGQASLEILTPWE